MASVVSYRPTSAIEKEAFDFLVPHRRLHRSNTVQDLIICLSLRHLHRQ